jgi:hypothetical protein
MATKKAKVENLFVVTDSGRCFVDEDGSPIEDYDSLIFTAEKIALDAAQDAMSSDEQLFDEDEVLTVFKLVPVARVKRAAPVVEKL